MKLKKVCFIIVLCVMYKFVISYFKYKTTLRQEENVKHKREPQSISYTANRRQHLIANEKELQLEGKKKTHFKPVI